MGMGHQLLSLENLFQCVTTPCGEEMFPNVQAPGAALCHSPVS